MTYEEFREFKGLTLRRIFGRSGIMITWPESPIKLVEITYRL